MLRFIDFALTLSPEIKKSNLLRGRGSGLNGHPELPLPPQLRLDALGTFFKQLH